MRGLNVLKGRNFAKNNTMGIDELNKFREFLKRRKDGELIDEIKSIERTCGYDAKVNPIILDNYKDQHHLLSVELNTRGYLTW